VHACLKRLLWRRCVPLAEPAGHRVLGGRCVSNWASIARNAQGHEAVGRPAKLIEDGYGFIESLAEQEAWSGSGRLTHDSVSFLPTICGIPFPLRDLRPRKFVESNWDHFAENILGWPFEPGRRVF
jgi:hypothetical protein